MADPIIKVLTRATWSLLDGDNPPGQRQKGIDIPPGEYEVELIRNPFYPRVDRPWLVLKGTKIGQTAGAWLCWRNGQLNTKNEPIDWGDDEILVSVDGVVLGPEIINLDHLGLVEIIR